MTTYKKGDNAKRIIYGILDYALTWGGPAGLIIYSYISEDTSTGFKISFTGILLLVALIFTAKAEFTKKYRNNYDTLLQALGNADTRADKDAISQKINALKTGNDIWNRVTLLLPFAVLFIVSYFGEIALGELNSMCGIILASMGAGSVFSVIRRPVNERYRIYRITKK